MSINVHTEQGTQHRQTLDNRIAIQLMFIEQGTNLKLDE